MTIADEKTTNYVTVIIIRVTALVDIPERIVIFKMYCFIKMFVLISEKLDDRLRGSLLEMLRRRQYLRREIGTLFLKCSGSQPVRHGIFVMSTGKY
jgi:hypothetical protein